MPPFKAGSGEHHLYRIPTESPVDRLPLTTGQHYVGIDAVSWFAEKQGSWYADYMASGTLEIMLNLGAKEEEKYEVALGSFELKQGAKTAPVFDEPVLPDRCYRGGPIRLRAVLYDLKKDTAIAALLNSAASASLGVVAGMVQTATLAGPSKVLGDAGGALVGGVKTILENKANVKEPLFDLSGIKKSFQPKDLVGPEIYFLFHRGDKLDGSALKVKDDGEITRPFLNDQPLEDGAWLLLRVRRSSEYSGFRDWFATKAPSLSSSRT